MTNDTVRYRFTTSGHSPYATHPERPDRSRDVAAPIDSQDHWFLDTLRISQLDPTFPVGTKLVLTVPNPDPDTPDYVRTWEVLA